MEMIEQTRVFLRELSRGYAGMGFWVLSQKEPSGAGPFGRVSGTSDQVDVLAEFVHRPGTVGADQIRRGGLGGVDVYVGVNPHRQQPQPPKRGTARTVDAYAGVAIELDGYKLRNQNGEARGWGVLGRLEADGLAPTMVVASGGADAYHAYWLLEDAVILEGEDDRERCRQLGQRMTRLVEGMLGQPIDHVYDLPRVLRVAGTVNSKHRTLATLVSAGGPRYHLPELEACLPEVSGGQIGGARALTEEERAACFGLQGTCPEDIREGRGSRLVEQYCRWWDDGRSRFNGGRDNAVYQLCRDLNNALIPDADALEYARQLAEHVGEYDQDGNREPIDVMAKVRSAYQNPPQPIPEWMPGNQTEGDIDPRERAPDGFELNDDGNARRLVAAADGRIRYSPRTREWLYWEGTRWTDDPEGLRVEALIPGVSNRVVGQVPLIPDDDRKQKLLAWAIRMKDSTRTESMIKRARKLVTVQPWELDADPWLLNTPTGTLDLRTGELRQVHDPSNLITHLCPTPYDPEARDERWERALRDALWSEEYGDALLIYFQRFCGYCLTGMTGEKAILVPYGQTNSGKSTLTEPFYRMLGDTAEGGYATSWNSDVVEENPRVNRDEKLNKQRGARLVVVGELRRGSRMADNFVKQYSGGDTLDHRALYGQSYSMRPQGKLVMHTNYVPRSTDPAVHGRLKLLPFDNVPRELDLGLKPYLDSDPGAHRAILAWAVRGCLDWQRSGLGETPWLEERLRRYSRDSDPIVAFVEDCFTTESEQDLWIGAPLLSQIYGAWAEENLSARARVGRNTLYSMLAERGYPKRKWPVTGGTWRVAGLRLRALEDLPEEIVGVIIAAELQ